LKRISIIFQCPRNEWTGDMAAGSMTVDIISWK
jgi:hypothetical protein